MKRTVIFLLGLTGLTSIVFRPISLAATDHIVVKQPDYSAVGPLVAARADVDAAAPATAQSVDAAQPISLAWTGIQPTPLELSSPAPSELPIASDDPTLVSNDPAPFVPAARYRVTVTLNSLQAYLTTNQTPLSYSDIYRFRRMIFGHNTANLLGNLANLSVGQIIAISEGANTTYYRVAALATYENTPDGLNGDPRFINELTLNAGGHDLALLTCAGTSYGNGKASHRLVVYVDAL